MPAVLDAVWAEARWPAAQRRRVIFELWDECSEDGAEELVRASQAVRATIEAFVRKRLPRGSADAFTDDELDAINAGRGDRPRFRPYRPMADAPE
jgi:hypothetical protein